MSTALATAVESGAAIMENVLIRGDLSKLTPQERSEYYLRVCDSVGLNPLTKPFEYILLNGKLVLYATRACTDQLRTLHKVSVEELSETERDGVFIVTAKVKNGEGRTDMAKGAVTIGGLKGDALANAMMKCETKAKRRATLSLCGLGFLDETEIETIPAAARSAPKAAPVALVKPDDTPEHDPETGEITGPYEIEADDWIDFGQRYLRALEQSLSLDECNEWASKNQAKLDLLKQEQAKVHVRLTAAVERARVRFAASPGLGE